MQNILLTGGSGYIGAMIANELAKNNKVNAIYIIDKDKLPSMIEGNSKIKFIHKNLVEDWEQDLKDKIDTVIHAAWQIRELYGRQHVAYHWNIDGSNKLFDYVFKNNINNLIHFSSIASYGPYSNNKLSDVFDEDMELRPSIYTYAEEKRIAEINLKFKYANAVLNGYNGKIAIVRPASVTGPRGKYGRVSFGLQSALSGSIRGKGSLIFDIVSILTAFTPVTRKWLRQYVHEDDVVDIVTQLATHNNNISNYEIFNLCPPGEPVLGSDMAKAVNKRALYLHPNIIRVVFYIAWHMTKGKISTGPGVWMGYSFPIHVTGEKVTRQLNYKYKFDTREAFTKNEGRYALVAKSS